MNKREYINRVELRLKKYNVENLHTVLGNYEITIDEILKENTMDTVLEKLGNPESLADSYAKEFGYVLKKENNNIKKYKSNSGLKFLKVILILIQVALTFSFIIGMTLMIAFNTNLKINYTGEKSNPEVMAFCLNDQCIGSKNIQTTDSSTSGDLCFNYQECFENQSNVNEYRLNLFLPFLGSNMVVLIIIIAIYVLGIRNVNKSIKFNNKYNKKIS